MILHVGLGAMAGLGLWCLLRAFTIPRPSLEAELAALSEARPAGSGKAHRSGRSVAHRVAGWTGTVTGSETRSFATDLALLDRSEEAHVVQRLRTAGFYGCLPPAVWLATTGAGAPIARAAHVALAAAVFAVAGWLLTDAQVRSSARRRRAEAEAVLVTYLQLVSVLLAGGAGTHQALHEAVEHGRGWLFQVLRRALAEARIQGYSPWQAFGEHGRQLGLDCLVDLAATMELAGSSGAIVRDSLTAKARALRSRHVAAIERDAAGRTTAMTGPTGLMMAGFVVLVIYPAFQAVLDL